MQKIIENINGRIEAALNNGVVIPLGLAHGKMGVCLYFYRLGRQENNNRYSKLAERLLDEIFEQIGVLKSIDMENGLSGMGLGISYLLRNGYVQGDENKILREIDDEIFKQVSIMKQTEVKSEDVRLLIQILYYAYTRRQSLSGEQEYLWNELAIYIMNILHSRIGLVLDDNAVSFNLDFNLPLSLLAMSKMYETGILSYKIERIMREITPFILSKYGYTDSQRLYLLWSIGKMNKHIKDSRLTEHCDLLVSRINCDSVLAEFRNKNVFFRNGLAGVALLMMTLDNDACLTLDTKDFYAKAVDKIEKSLIWEQDDDYLMGHVGLSGYCGTAAILNEISQRI